MMGYLERGKQQEARGATRALKYAYAWSGSAHASWPNALVTLALKGSAAASVTFWASAESSLVCSVSVSNCLRECSVDTSMKSEGDFTVDSFWAKPKAASVLVRANSRTLLL